MNSFRDQIICAVYDRLYFLEIHSDKDDPDRLKRPNAPYKKEPEFQTDPPIRVRTPNFIEASDPLKGRYNTPLWQVQLRPVTPQDVEQNDVIPSCFIKIVSGTRSATGRGLKNSPVISTLDEITEDYEVWIQCVFRDKYGAEDLDDKGNRKQILDPNSGQLVDKAKSLSEQINGFIDDLDKLLNVETLRPALVNANVIDAYIGDWIVVQAMEGSPDEVVIAKLIVTINFERGS